MNVYRKLRFAKVELIDTLWNVNPYGINYQSNGRKELIDTLWNVNYIRKLADGINVLGINRYIMECKYNRRIACCR